jgi:hypothetical protein
MKDPELELEPASILADPLDEPDDELELDDEPPEPELVDVLGEPEPDELLPESVIAPEDPLVEPELDDSPGDVQGPPLGELIPHEAPTRDAATKTATHERLRTIDTFILELLRLEPHGTNGGRFSERKTAAATTKDEYA